MLRYLSDVLLDFPELPVQQYLIYIRAGTTRRHP